MRLRLKGFFGRIFRRPEQGAPRPTGSREKHGLPDTTLANVRVEYDPALDGDPDPGEVVWAWVSFEEDPTQGKDRPVVIIGRTGEYLAGVALTTKGSHRRENIAVGTGAWDPSGRPSYAKLDRVLRIDPDRVRREGAVLERSQFDRVISGLHAIARQ